MTIFYHLERIMIIFIVIDVIYNLNKR